MKDKSLRPVTLFDCLNEVISDKRGDRWNDPSFQRAWSSFMLCRYLSMDPRFVSIAVTANGLQTTLSSEQMYKFLVKTVPRQQRTFIKYISRKKKEAVEQD